MNENIKIRPYEEIDRESILNLCADTGFLGKPIDSVFMDRSLFSKFIMGPYLEREARHTWVMTDNEKPIAYVTGTTDPNFRLKNAPHFTKTCLTMLTKSLIGKYAAHPRSEEYVKWFFTRGIKEIPKHPYGLPEIHINFAKGHRGSAKLSLQLLKKLEDSLRAEGHKEYFGNGSIGNRRSLRACAYFGFRPYDQVELTCFKPELPNETIYKACLVKRLN